MNILIRLLGRDHRTLPRRLPAHASDELPVELDGGADDRPLGCGWFDSSHELRCGLWVHEHTDTDEIAAALPLSWWLVINASQLPPAGCAATVDELTMRAEPPAGIIASCH